MRVSPPICPPITRWTGSGVRSVTDITQGAKSSRAKAGFRPVPRVRRRAATWMGKREAYSLSGCLTPFSAAPTLCQTDAGVAELADAQDSGSCGVHSSCGFKSLLRYQETGARGFHGSLSFGPVEPPRSRGVRDVRDSELPSCAQRGLGSQVPPPVPKDRGPWVSWAPVLWLRGAASIPWSSRRPRQRTP
jgi:hypothetical protein